MRVSPGKWGRQLAFPSQIRLHIRNAPAIRYHYFISGVFHDIDFNNIPGVGQ